MTMMASTPSPANPVRTDAPVVPHTAPTILCARDGWVSVDFKELWRYRELCWFLALRDIQLRYKQTTLGAAWAIIQPVFTMIVFTIFFGKLGGMAANTGGPPYYLTVFLCCLLPVAVVCQLAFAIGQ